MRSGVFSDFLTILTQNLSRAHQVYWHHFSGNAAVARDIENALPYVVFGVAPGVLKEQYDGVLEDFIRSTAPERLLVESDAPMVGERRTSNHLWVLLTFASFDCLAASNWPPGHPRSDHHVSNPHRPDYY